MTANNQQTTAERKLKEIENKLVDIISSLGYLKGRTPKHAKISSLIYINKKATQKLLRERTGYSLGTISHILQSLEKMGIIQKTQDQQTREYIYKLEDTITQPGSPAVTNIFEYFSKQKEFLKKIKTRLEQPHLSNKKGYGTLNEFVNKMDNIFPAMEHATQKILKQISNGKGSGQQ